LSSFRSFVRGVSYSLLLWLLSSETKDGRLNVVILHHCGQSALLQVLQNLVNLLGIPSSLNFAVMGAVIFLGVFVDQVSGQRKKKKQVLAPAPTPTSGQCDTGANVVPFPGRNARPIATPLRDRRVALINALEQWLAALKARDLNVLIQDLLEQMMPGISCYLPPFSWSLSRLRAPDSTAPQGARALGWLS
jgi:hypothetical protein